MADMSGEIPIDTPKKLQVFKKLKARGLSYSAIAGIMGNIDHETGGTYNFQEIQGEDDTGPGYGLFQFEKPHRDAYNNYLTKYKKGDSVSSQIDYVLDNINKGEGVNIGGKNRKRLIKSFESDSPEDIAVKFSNHFLNPGIPHNDRRIKSAIGIYDKLIQRKTGGRIMNDPNKTYNTQRAI
jgi:hypothetical protein